MFETKRNRESSHFKRALAARKKDRMHSLMEKQEAEKAQVGLSNFPCIIFIPYHSSQPCQLKDSVFHRRISLETWEPFLNNDQFLECNIFYFERRALQIFS